MCFDVIWVCAENEYYMIFSVQTIKFSGKWEDGFDMIVGFA